MGFNAGELRLTVEFSRSIVAANRFRKAILGNIRADKAGMIVIWIRRDLARM